MRVDEFAHLGGNGEDDPVGDLEALLLAERVDAVDEVERLALEEQLVVEREIEGDRDTVR